MFSWFRNSCPVDPVTRAWIETRWRWLVGEFGSDTLVDARTVLPNAEFFPDPYDHSEAAGQQLLDRVSKYMRVDTALIQLRYFSEQRKFDLVNQEGHAIGAAAGTYHANDSSFVVRIERSQLQDPMDLVGTLAHELAHVRLLGEGRVDADVFDNEILTDLTVVFHGMGIFLANRPRHWRSGVSLWPGTNVPKPEYMTTPMYGYALAYRESLREEASIKWKKHLRPGVRAEFNQASRYLRQLYSEPR